VGAARAGVSAPAPQARLFAALDLPEPVRQALAGWALDTVGDHEELRLVAPESLHVTLCFLGGRPETDAPRIGALVAACAGPVRGLALVEALWLAPRRPRVLAAGVVDPEGALAALQGRASDALAAGAGFAPEARPYRPHVTVARVRGGARVRADALEPPPPLAFDGAAVTLYRSHPGRGGARYEPVSRTPV
jgi:2'-5' RNA ligase